MTAARPAAWLCIAAGVVFAAPAMAAGPRTLLDFNAPAGWQVSASDDVSAALRVVPGQDGEALCLDYDLHGTAGYASMRRKLPLALPSNYRFDLAVRGSGAANTLQFKLLDASGDNVWWHTWPDFAPPAGWTDLPIDKAAVTFAWGPRKDHALAASANLELTVAAGRGGGRGSICFDALRLTALPVTPSTAPAPPSLAGNPDAWFEQHARQVRRGLYPRAFSGGQSYWTLVGVDGGAHSGLLSEDGALEVARGGFSIEPFLVDGGKLVTWADVETTHTLQDGYLPIPTVAWKHDGLRLEITAFGSGQRGAARLVARYDVVNDSDRARDVTLALALRPFQVDPPTQFLNAPGGVSPIHRLARQGRELEVDRVPRVRLLQPPDAWGATTLEAGGVTRWLVQGRVPPATVAFDPQGFASGAVLYRLRLAPHAMRSIGLLVPLDAATPVAVPTDAVGWLRDEQARVAAQWRQRLDRVTLRLPPAQQRLADTLRSSLAWILMSRDGAELRPGTRSYARSWIRDGAMMADALLRLGDADAARDYALWYAPHQFSTGKLPCCVDQRGADPTPENDSPGEFLHLVAQVYRYTGDKAFLQTLWPHVGATVAYMHGLIGTQSGPACRDPATRLFCGLLPASISHEGYSAHPEHSYWDDFWGLAGYRGAIDVARALGHRDQAEAWSRQRERFHDDVFASIRASVAAHHIDFIPGSAELGDFDPTSTTVALEPGGELEALRRELPPGLLHDTFARYWRESLARADGSKPWDDYTPYEWRNVGVFARLGWRDRIPAMLDFLFAGQRPAGWNGWAEVVGHDARKPRFIGDLPHAWVASDYIRAVLDLFAWHRHADDALVLAAGVQPGWLEHGGIALHGLRTPWGRLAYTLQRDGGELAWRIEAGVDPPGGVVLTWPLAGAPGATRVNGRPAQWKHGRLRLRTLPADVVVEIDTTGSHTGDPEIHARADR